MNFLVNLDFFAFQLKPSTGNFCDLNEFGVSVAILLGGANFGQNSIKYCDLDCNVEPLPFKNCKNLTMKLEVKYLFPNSSSDSNLYIYQLPEGLATRKILAHAIKMQMNPETR